MLRYGLVAVLVWFGAFKFTPAEAEAIRPLIANSPLLSWLYSVGSVAAASRLIGITELLIAGLIALRPLAPRWSALGSLAAAAMFAITLSFLASTPGIWVHVDGFIVPNETGAFLIKDFFLLGAALWTASEALAGPGAPPIAGPNAGTRAPNLGSPALWEKGARIIPTRIESARERNRTRGSTLLCSSCHEGSVCNAAIDSRTRRYR
jgi:reactive chlorine resistance protein C